MRKLFSVIAAVMMSLTVLAACNTRQPDPSEDIVGIRGYAVPQYDESLEIEIGAWESPGAKDYSQRAFDLIADSGINILMPMYDFADFAFGGEAKTTQLAILDRAYNASLKVLVSDSDLVDHQMYGAGLDKPSVFDNVRYYEEHPAFHGVYMVDEPTGARFPLVKEKYDIVKGRFPDKRAFIDIVPAYTPQGMGYPTYEALVRDYLQVTGDEWCQFQIYPLVVDKTLREDYYNNIEIVKRVSVEYGAKSSCCIMIQKATDGLYSARGGYADPGVAGIRWQMAVLQAYGFHQFIDYTYGTSDPAYEFVIDNKGNPTKVWTNLRAANREVREWDHVYMSFVDGWEGTAVIRGANLVSGGEESWMLNMIKQSVKPGEIPGIKSVTSDESVLMGIFKDNKAAKNKGFMATNATNLWDGKTAKMTVQFDKEYKGVMVFEKGIPEIYDLDKNNNAVITLEPGEGKFIMPLKKM